MTGPFENINNDEFEDHVCIECSPNFYRVPCEDGRCEVINKPDIYDEIRRTKCEKLFDDLEFEHRYDSQLEIIKRNISDINRKMEMIIQENRKMTRYFKTEANKVKQYKAHVAELKFLNESMEILALVDENSRKETEDTEEMKPFVKSKVTIVACHHGKNLATSLSLLSDDIMVEAIIKPDATDFELIKTALDYARKLTNRDFIILWPSRLHPMIADIFAQAANNTNPIILSQPYQYDENFNNLSVFNDNASVHRDLISRRNKTVDMLDCNEILRKCNYFRNGTAIKIIGKRFIAKRLLASINNYLSVWRHS